MVLIRRLRGGLRLAKLAHQLLELVIGILLTLHLSCDVVSKLLNGALARISCGRGFLHVCVVCLFVLVHYYIYQISYLLLKVDVAKYQIIKLILGYN